MSSSDEIQELEAGEGWERKPEASSSQVESRPRLKNSITTREQAYQYLADAAAYLEKEIPTVLFLTWSTRPLTGAG